jgi:sulfur carrier protein
VNATINGEARVLPAGATVASVLELLDVTPDARGIAVAVDGEVVARSLWDATALRDGSMVEVLAAIGGG